jgi:hypothetical protein
MTDLEVCKRIAEIEGLINHIYFRKVQVDRTPNKSINTSWINWEDYNPLTDDALNHQLMVKYKIDLDFTDDGYTRAWQYHHICGQDTLNKNPKKAILLAIIEAHK